jgi:dephospho-CoA kinase
VRGAERGIDRAALGAIVFADRARREALDALVHPPLLAELRRRLDALAAAGHEAAVLEAALLLRWGPPEFIDVVVGVSAPRSVRRGRLLAQGLTPEDVERRLDLQLDEDELARRAEFIVVNDGDLDRLMHGIDDLAAFLRRRARGEG